MFDIKKYVESLIRRRKKRKSGKEDFSRFEIAKGFLELRQSFYAFMGDIVLIALGVISAAFGLKSFLVPNKFIDGGATGISLLISQLTSLPLYFFIFIVNIPFLILGYNVVSRQFTVKAAFAIFALALTLATVHFPEVTHDKLLVAVFGGFFLGAGIGLSVRGGGVLDGTELLAIYISRKLRTTTVGDVILIINIIIFSAAAYFLSIEAALYSMLTYLSASKTLDFIIEGIEEYTGVTIISVRSEEMRLMITDSLGRGVTVYKGKRGYGKHGHTSEIDIVYTVITRLEINKLNSEIERIDPDAFVIMNSIKDTKGGMIKKRPLKR